MLYCVTKDTRINIRLTPEFRSQLEAVAGYYGLTLSSYVHSLLVRSLRQEKEAIPEVFTSAGKLAPVLARIEPGEAVPPVEETEDQIRARIISELAAGTLKVPRLKVMPEAEIGKKKRDEEVKPKKKTG